MKKYSKGKLKFKRIGIILAILLAVMLVIGIIMLFCFCLNKNITKEYTSDKATSVSDDEAQNSYPIIIDNLVIGAVYNGKWVSASKWYLKSTNKSDIDIYVYNKDARAGTYTISEVYSSDDSVFVNTTYVNYTEEYFALGQDTTYALISPFNETDITEKDYNYVKKALGIYRIYNHSIDIKSVYEGYIDIDTPIRIITVTSSQRGIFDGVYSATIVAFTTENRAEIIQYSYTKDYDNSSDFPVYSVEFLADLNGDGSSELVTRAVTEFNVIYNVFEYQNKKFYKVLSETISN